MILNLKSALRVVWLGTVATGILAAGPVLSLTPSNSLTGNPGSTVGWGFTLTNNVSWIEVVEAQFCLDAVIGNPCFNPSSQFFDIISNPPNDVIVGPGGSASQPYDPSNNKGLGKFTIAPGAPNGSSVVGNILLTYNTFDNDPNNGGNQIGFNDAISAAAKVTAVPEPAGLALAGLALAGLAALRLRQPISLSPRSLRSPAPIAVSSRAETVRERGERIHETVYSGTSATYSMSLK
jgi:hypothetical protein